MYSLNSHEIPGEICNDRIKQNEYSCVLSIQIGYFYRCLFLNRNNRNQHRSITDASGRSFRLDRIATVGRRNDTKVQSERIV